MKTNFKKTTLALAISGLMASPVAFAIDPPTGTSDATITYNNNLNVSLEKHAFSDVFTAVFGIAVLDPQNAANALIDDKQIITGNATVEILEVNAADVNNSLNGNIGSAQSNIAAGVNNNQDNAGAIAANLSGVAGFADAGIMVFQDIQNDLAIQILQANTASLTDSLNGNIGSAQSNVAAGVFNNQKNNLAVAVANDGILATASVGSLQQISGNLTVSIAQANIASVSGSISGNIGSVQSNVVAGVGNNQSNSLAIAAGL
jgi:hypothetical protein